MVLQLCENNVGVSEYLLYFGICDGTNNNC